jgi:hypothetical protein
MPECDMVSVGWCGLGSVGGLNVCIGDGRNGARDDGGEEDVEADSLIDLSTS